MEKWKVGVGGNGLLSKYWAALKQSDAKGQIIRWGKERNVMFYFHYRPLQLCRWLMFTNIAKSQIKASSWASADSAAPTTCLSAN